MNFFPYMEVNGAWTLRDDEMVSLFEQFEKEGTINSIFRDNIVYDPQSFINHFKRNGFLYFWTVDDKIGGIFWLTNIDCRRCELHYNALKWTWGEKVVEAGHKALDILLDYWDSIVGIVPIDNPLALRCCMKSGMIKRGQLPKAVYDYGENKSLDAWLLSITREEFDARYKQ